MDDPPADTSAGCPYVETNDRRCGSRFNIARIEQAFNVCLGAFGACPMYHQITAERSRPARPTPLITVTVSADAIRRDAPEPLRATGT